MRPRLRRTLRTLGLLVFAVLAVWLVPTLWFRPWSIDVFYMRVFLQFATRNPSLMTEVGLFEGMPFDFWSDKLDNFSPENQVRDREFIEEQLRTLHGYDRAHMSASAALSYDVMDWFLDDQARGNRDFMHYDFPVNQLAGFQSLLPDFLINLHPMHTPRDAQNYVKRLARFGVATDQQIEGLDVRLKEHILPPRWSLQKSIDQMRAFRAHAPKDNPLYATLVPKLDKMKGLTPAERDRVLADVETQITTTVYPAWDRLIAATGRQLAAAGDDDGVWRLPHGDAYYAYCLRHNTTTDLPADTIHAVGLAEVARIQGQMKSILRREGYGAENLAAAMQRLEKEPRFTYPDNDAGRDSILADYRAILADANRRVPALFGRMPKATLAVRRVPPFRESGSSGAYYQPGSLNGSRPGAFYANLRDPSETSRMEMRTTAYHEGIPGHHFQISIQQELKGVPYFRKLIPFTAFAEGWGLYAEHLALENGFHPTPYDSLGAYQMELFRAVRLVVDTGIHRDRWTRQQAIDYMIANTGMDSSKVATEIERYIVNPGQACAYKVGQLDILRVRQRAMDALGPRFDLKRFHDVVLTNGSLPLSLLERVIADWIASAQHGAATRRAG
jgi:uncharacterized protein (DUF885 family)